MSLEQAFKRLAIRPSRVCHECRRSFGSTTPRQQQRNATAALHDSFTNAPKPSTAQRTPSPPTHDAFGPVTPPSGSHELARSAILEASASTRERKRAQELADINRQFTRRDLELQIARRFKVGDVYAPHDLSGAEMSKWKKLRRKPRSKFDVLDQLGINPLEHYKNFNMMSEYITPMGRIRHGNDTGLRPVNQRKMAKAIRRAMGMGLMPGVHRHPEILKIQERMRRQAPPR